MMNTEKRKMRLWYAFALIVIFLIEVLIALFVRDSFIRPYGGDILVTILICCFIRIFFLQKIKFLPILVFLFSLAVEIGQYFDFVTLLGLGEIRFFRILLGSSFSVLDILCYGAGCIIFYVCEKLILNKTKS